MQESEIILHGQCLVCFAFDIGSSTNLERCRELLGERAEWRHVTRALRRSPSYLSAVPGSLSMTRHVEPLQIGEFHTAREVTISLFDFGAVSVTLSVPIQSTLSQLAALSERLYENEQFFQAARSEVEALLSTIKPAVSSCNLARTFEDYCIYWFDSVSPSQLAAKLHLEHPSAVAAILRSERERLSEQEIRDALQHCLTYTHNDLVCIDWNSALVVGKEMADVVALLEYANIELLELAFLDHCLKEFSDRSYELLQTEKITGPDVQLVRRFQIDTTDLLADINNPLRLFGDYFLARVHKAVADRFDLPAWLSSVEKRLEGLSMVASQMEEHKRETRSHRMEVLIASLIAIDLVLVVMSMYLGAH